MTVDDTDFKDVNVKEPQAHWEILAFENLRFLSHVKIDPSNRRLNLQTLLKAGFTDPEALCFYFFDASFKITRWLVYNELNGAVTRSQLNNPKDADFMGLNAWNTNGNNGLLFNKVLCHVLVRVSKMYPSVHLLLSMFLFQLSFHFNKYVWQQKPNAVNSKFHFVRSWANSLQHSYYIRFKMHS